MSELEDLVGFTIFCDDIRSEVSQQYSLIGVYTSAIFIDRPFPATLPKLAFHTRILEPFHLIIKRDFPIEVGVYLPGDDVSGQPTFNHTLNPDPESARALAAQTPKGMALLLLHVIAAPVVFREPGVVRVQAKYKERIVPCGTLQVISSIDTSAAPSS